MPPSMPRKRQEGGFGPRDDGELQSSPLNSEWVRTVLPLDLPGYESNKCSITRTPCQIPEESALSKTNGRFKAELLVR